MQRRHATDIDISGFAGVRERVYVRDAGRFGTPGSDNAVNGIGPLHYLADAHMRPLASTGLHRHENVVIVTLVVNGCLTHQGSLGDGQRVKAGEIQVQSSGPAGFSHNEINPGPDYCRFLQLWLTPSQPLTTADYAVTPLAGAGATAVALPDRVAALSLQVHQLNPGDGLSLPGAALLYLVSGELALAQEDAQLARETLLRGNDITVTATRPALLLSARHA